MNYSERHTIEAIKLIFAHQLVSAVICNGFGIVLASYTLLKIYPEFDLSFWWKIIGVAALVDILPGAI